MYFVLRLLCSRWQFIVTINTGAGRSNYSFLVLEKWFWKKSVAWKSRCSPDESLLKTVGTKHYYNFS